MNKKPLFSVIIPTRNPNMDYFSFCIDSICNQTFRDFEIIIVANGCDDEHIRLIEGLSRKIGANLLTPNDVGLSRARNHGVEIAKGEYIVFVDDDDAINVTFLEAAKRAFDDEVDLVCFIDTDNPSYLKKDITKYLKYDKKQVADAFFKNDNIHKICETRTACAKVYKKEIVEKNKLVFIHDLPAEDIVFNLEYASKVNSMAVFSSRDEYGYYYRYRPESISHRLDTRMVERFDSFNDEVARILSDNNMSLSFLYFHICNQSIYNIAISYIFHKDLKCSFLKRNKLFKSLFKHNYYRDSIKVIKLKMMFTFKKKLMLFFLKAHLYCLSSLLLYRRYSR